MMTKKFFVFVLFLTMSSTFALAQKPHTQRLLTNEKGFVICSGGGTSAPLFNRECKKLTISRVSMQGAIKYEGTCVDSNETTFLLTCDAFNFEYGRMFSPSKPESPKRFP